MILSTHGIVSSQILQASGLLIDYPGAAAAYSLRLLRTNYTGSAIRVRIDTTGQPEYNIGFVNNELDVATLEGYCTGGLNAFVITWYDQSGNGYDVTQATDANQPQIVSSGSVLTNLSNLPTLRTDGVNDNLKTSITELTGAYTIFMVSKWISITNSFPYLVDFRQDAALGYISGAGGKNEAFFGANLTSSININFTSSLLWYVLVNIPNPTSSQLSINNESVITGNLGTRKADKVVIGSRSTDNINANSFYSELILYPSNQSTNRSGIETNINDFYSIY